MGTKELNLAEPITKKIFKNYEDENIRVGICLMQGWRKTMEDTSLTMPNFDGKGNSLFGIFDGHGGSIISQFVGCNIENVLKNSEYYEKANYEQALIDSFISLDELLKNKDVDTFLKKIMTHQKSNIDNFGEKASSIINKELLRDNIKNDPYADYLFFCYSSLDNETNLRYQLPNMEKYIKKKNILVENNNNTDKNNNKNKINSGNENRKYVSFKIINEDIDKNNNVNNNIKIKDTNDLDIRKNKIMDEEDITDRKKHRTTEYKDIFPMKEKPINLISNDIGTTANVLLLKKNYFYIANVGDSLSVMYKKKKAIKLNKEHKTTSDKEFNRIKKIGGKLINYRINGKLNITRAIGDLSYKTRNNGFIYQQDVIAIPEVNKYSLEDVDFIVMGSDGFWDYGDDIKTICDNIYNELKKDPERDLCNLIGNIFDKALAKANNYLRGTDNMSCIIIQFIKKG